MRDINHRSGPGGDAMNLCGLGPLTRRGGHKCGRKYTIAHGEKDGGGLVVTTLDIYHTPPSQSTLRPFVNTVINKANTTISST